MKQEVGVVRKQNSLCPQGRRRWETAVWTKVCCGCVYFVLPLTLAMKFCCLSTQSYRPSKYFLYWFWYLHKARFELKNCDLNKKAGTAWNTQRKATSANPFLPEPSDWAKCPVSVSDMTASGCTRRIYSPVQAAPQVHSHFTSWATVATL